MFKGRDGRDISSSGLQREKFSQEVTLYHSLLSVLPFKPAHKVSLQCTDVGLGLGGGARQETYFLYLQQVHTLHCAGCNYHHIGAHCPSIVAGQHWSLALVPPPAGIETCH